MKRSKVFLGLTSGLLAVVGIVAAKESKFHSTSYKVFTQPNNAGRCVAAGSVSATITGGSSTTLVTQISTTNPNLYFTSPSCAKPLFSGE